jgi:hypothetical protein
MYFQMVFSNGIDGKGGRWEVSLHSDGRDGRRSNHAQV